jgi:hypothetical protein
MVQYEIYPQGRYSVGLPAVLKHEMGLQWVRHRPQPHELGHSVHHLVGRAKQLLALHDQQPVGREALQPLEQLRGIQTPHHRGTTLLEQAPRIAAAVNTARAEHGVCGTRRVADDGRTAKAVFSQIGNLK